MSDAAVSVCCPIEPHDIPKKMANGLQDIVRRVAAQSAVRGSGSDLLLRVYLAGLYHGVELGSRP